ncbi:MAG: PxKF domain-containing protein [Pyrinomonadaceae bacterium]
MNIRNALFGLMSRLLVLAFAFTAASAHAQTPYQTAVLADNPASYWSFEETSGTTIADNQALNNGTLIGAPILNQPGAPGGGQSIRFASGGYVKILNDSSITFTDTFTIEMWIKPTTTSGQIYILDKDYDEYSIILGYQGANSNFFSRVGYPAGVSSAQMPVVVNDWQHIVYVKDANGLANNWRGYLNGCEFFSVTANFSLPQAVPGAWPASRDLHLGSSRNFFNYYGYLDEVAVYDHALSGSQVAAHYDAATGSLPVCGPNAAPAADAGGPYSGEFGSNIALFGATASDPDMDVLTYAWTVNSASCSFDDASVLNPTLTCNATGNFTATLEVSDGVNPPVSSDAAVMINKAATTTTVTCAAGPYTYTGAAQTPCSASVTGPGGLNLTPTPDYANHTDAGTANASYTYAESANHLGSNDSENFTIDKAGLNVTPDAQQILIGSPDPTFTFSYSGFVNSEGSGVVDTAPTCGVTGVHTGVGSYTITCSGGVDNNYSFTYGTATLKVVYNFNGFFNPIDNVNQNNVKAGQGIPVKFSLNGNFGLNILAAGYPVSYQVPCAGTGDNGEEIPTVTAGNSSLSYDAAVDQYNYVWKTNKSWQGTCRVLLVRLNDGSSHTASFRFR